MVFTLFSSQIMDISQLSKYAIRVGLDIFTSKQNNRFPFRKSLHSGGHLHQGSVVAAGGNNQISTIQNINDAA